MINIVKKYNDGRENAEELFSTISQLGGMDYARKKMDEYKTRAYESLDKLPDAEIKPKFKELIQYVIDRRA